MNLREFEKRRCQERVEQQALRELNSALSVLERKKTEYAAEIKSALKCGRDCRVPIALMKHAIYNTAVIRDMLDNIKIAIDCREMQTVSRNFDKSFNKIMKSVAGSVLFRSMAGKRKMFTKALDKYGYSAMRLRQMLKDNGIVFSMGVSDLSDISDEEVKSAVMSEIDMENDDIAAIVRNLEAEFASVRAKGQSRAESDGKERFGSPVPARPSAEASAQPPNDTPVQPSAPVVRHKVPAAISSVPEAPVAGEDKDEQPAGTAPALPSAKINVAGAALRPQRLDDYLGQPAAIATLKTSVKSALLMGKALPHLLLCGSYGQGKTTLAKIVAKEMGGGFIEVNSRIKSRDMIRILRDLKEGDVIFVDEVHQLSPEIIETILYPAMEDFELHLTESNSVRSGCKVEKVAPFTLIAATTETGKLLKPFYSKFPLKITLAEYTPDVIAAIVKNSFGVFGLKISEDLCLKIAKRSRLTPRTANEYVVGIRDLVLLEESERRNITAKGALKDASAVAALGITVSEEQTEEYFSAKGIDENGLDDLQRKILSILIENYNGGPVGQDTIAKALNVANNRVDEEYEPYLVKLGLIGICPNGRFVTEAGFRYMGREKRVLNRQGARVAGRGNRSANGEPKNCGPNGRGAVAVPAAQEGEFPVIECAVGEHDKTAAERFALLLSGGGAATDRALDEIFPAVDKTYESAAQNRCVLKAGTREIYCDSKLERRFLAYLFKKGCVKDAKGEALELEYSSDSMSGKRYFPDFVLKLYDDTIAVVEMKNLPAFGYHLNIDKYEALARFCAENGYRYAEIGKDPETNRYVSAEQIKARPVNERLKEYIRNKIKQNGSCTEADLKAARADVKDIVCILLNDRTLKNSDRTGGNAHIVFA